MNFDGIDMNGGSWALGLGEPKYPAFYKRLFKGAKLEGQEISTIEVTENEEGIFVQLISEKPHALHSCLLFPKYL